MIKYLAFRVAIVLSVLLFTSNQVYSQTTVNGNVSGTWTKANSPYVLDGSVTIQAGQTLTIQPGVEVHSNQFNFQFVVNGTLKAKGTAVDSVRFIGYANPTYASYSTHAGSFIFDNSSTASEMEYVVIDRWGDASSGNGVMNINSPQVSITKSAIRNAEEFAIYLSNSSGAPTISGNRFASNGTAIRTDYGGLAPLITNNVFVANTNDLEMHPGSVSGITGNTNARISLTAGNINANSVWPKPGTGSHYEFPKGGTIAVSAGVTLEIQPGAEIRSLQFNDQFAIYGTLKAKGTATDSIRFIGYPNPSYSSSSTHGGYISFVNGSTNSEMEYVAIDRWGDSSSGNGVVNINSSGVSITKSAIRNAEDFAIYLSNSSGAPTISGNRFAGNGTAIKTDYDGLAPIITNNVFAANAKDLEMHPGSVSGVTGNTNVTVLLSAGNINANSVWPKPGTGSHYEFPKGGTISVSAGVTLEILAGVEVRSLQFNDQLAIYGTLKAKGTVTDSIRFNGYPNLAYSSSSTHGGYISFVNGGANSELEYVAMDRWGDASIGIGAININSSGVSITKSAIRNSETYAVYLISAAITPTISGNRFAGNETGIRTDYGGLTPVITNNTFAGNVKDMVMHPASVSGISGNANAVIHLLAGNTTTGNVWPKPGTGSYYQLPEGGTITVPTGETLEIKPGVEIHSNQFNDVLTISGTLKAKGTEADSIRFIGYANTGYSTASTHGGTLMFSNSSTNSELEYVVVDRWGDKDYYASALYVSTSGLTVSKSVIRNTEAVGINILSGGYAPNISEVRFAANQRDIEASPASVSGISNCANTAVYLRSGETGADFTMPKPGTNSYYVLTNNGFTVTASTTATILPGVEIRSMIYSDQIIINGKLIAKGTVADSIRFVGFANPTFAAASTHGGQLAFGNNSSGSELEYFVMNGWGDKQYYESAISIYGTGISITKSSIRNNEDVGIRIVSGPFNPTISGIKFSGNIRDIETNADNLSNLVNCENAKIYLRSESTSKDCTIPVPGTGSYYYLNGGDLTIGSNTTTTILPGVEIRSVNYADRIVVNGILIAKGTVSDSIRFVGFADPSVSASTHGGQIYFGNSSSGSALEYAVMDRWGDKDYHGFAISIATTDVSISKSSIRNSENVAVNISVDGVIPISGNAFAANFKDIVAGPSAVSGLANNSNCIVHINSGQLYSNVSWPLPGTNSYYILAGSITVPQATTLTIAAGNLIDIGSNSANLSVSGTLKAIGTESAPIRFVKLQSNTSYDGALYFHGSSTASDLKFVSVDQSKSAYGMYVATADISLGNISISNSANHGLYYSGGGTTTISNSNFFNNKTGIHVTSGSPKLVNSNIYGNTDFGIENSSSNPADIVDARSSYWGEASGPFHATSNPSGLGNKVSDKVLFVPWIQQTIKVDQTITFDEIPDKYPDEPFTLNAKASSDLAITYTVTTIPSSGVAVLTGNNITFPGTAGQITIRATQAGNAYFNPIETERTFNVRKRDQLIAFHGLASKTFGDAPFSLSGTATSGLALTFAVISGPATISANIVTLTAAGTVVIEARQPGNAVYKPAEAIQQSFIVYPKLPDLAVANVTSTQTTVLPNDIVTVSWNVVNDGIVASASDWTERIYIQSPTGENRTQIKQVTYSSASTLTPGQSISRSDAVVIPSQLTVGDQAVFVVEVLPGSTVQEVPGTQANNTSVQQTAWTIQKVLSLSLFGSEITEGTTNGITATVYRTGSLSAALTFNVSLTNAARFSFPATVTIPAGQIGTSFYLSVPENTTIEGTQTDQLQISASGYQSAQAGLTILDNDMPSLSISNLAASAMEGQTVTFRVNTNLAPTSPLSVFLQSNNQNRFPVPPSVTIAAGALYADVTVNLAQDNSPEIDLAVGITAGAANHNSANASIQINDDDLPSLELVIQTSSISESAGMNATQATLRRTSTSNSVAFTANISASLANTLVIPGAISMAAGENEKTFNIGVVDNNLVDGQRQVTVSASIFVASCGCNTPPATAGYVSAALTVNDNDGPTLQLTVAQQTLSEGLANAGSLRITRNTATTNPLTVALLSSDLTEATLPATAIIPAGESFVDVPITTINDNETDGSQQVYFSATASGFSSGSVWILVTELNKPDLQISAVQLNNNNVQAGSIFNYQVSVKNTGFSTAPAGALVRGYLSLDNVIDGSDVLISEDILQEAIPIGQTKILINAAQASDSPGQYKLLFWVNPDVSVVELITTNNKSEAVDLIVDPNYTATAVVSSPYFLKGNPITITGSATRTNGSPVANGQVEVYVITNGIRRNLTAITDASGNFTTQFSPLASEAGHYKVGASYPNLGQTTEQDAFDILGVSINGGTTPRFEVSLNEPSTGSLTIQNLSDKSLSNLTLTPIDLPGGASIQFTSIAQLAGNASGSVNYQILGSALSKGDNFETVNVRVTAGEGEVQSQKMYYFCQAPNALIVSDVSSFETSVSQSTKEKLVEIKIINKGKGATGTVNVNLPQASWIESVTSKTLTSIASGDTSIVTLKFLALEEVPFNYPINSSIGFVAQNGNSFTMPFNFKKVAESTGSVEIAVTDQFTYYTAGNPKVAGASIRIENYFTGELYAQGVTDNSGIFSIAGTPEGKHRLIVEKEKHKSYNNTIIINPGSQTHEVVFMEYEAVTFNWSVVPTAVQDQYDVTLDSKFETNVPMPVVTIDMPTVMPLLTGDQEYTFNVMLANHGLITAKDVVLNLPNDPEYEFITNYITTDLLAQQSILVPVLMRRKNAGGRATAGGELSNGLRLAGSESVSDAGPCQDAVGVYFWYECFLKPLGLSASKPIKYEGRCQERPSPDIWTDEDMMRYINQYNYWANVAVAWANAFQGVFDGGTLRPPTGCTNCGPAPESPEAPEYETKKKSCLQCINDWIGAAAGCFPGKIGTWVKKGSCAFGVWLEDDVLDRLGRLVKCGNPSKPPAGYSCINGINGALKTCSNVGSGNGRFNSSNGLLGASTDNIYEQISFDFQKVSDAYSARENWGKEYFGDMIYLDGWDDIAAMFENNINLRIVFPQTLQQNVLNAASSYDIPVSSLQAFFARWNSSVLAKDNGILIPNAEYPNIINWSLVKTYSDIMLEATIYSQSKGFESVADMYERQYEAMNKIIDGQKEEVCASVTVQFSQQLTMTREAFEGTLEIFNGHPTDAMKNLSVNIQITDQDGVPSNGLFEIQTKSLTNLANVTGSGEINADQKGSIKYLFIPELGAAPQTSKVYRFGGSITYFDPYAQALVTLPLASVPITVNPSPNLMLHYFMQRNVLGDDALTSPEIEPSVPAELAVMVENKGYGPAVNMTISSAQPKIVDNEKGLAINFNMVGSNFQGQPRQLGITDISFGTIPGRQTRIGQWYFTSSLLGKFVSYEANVVHANSFGNPDLSLVQGVKLHELTKSIKLYGTVDDGINDFLVNDIFDVNDTPDIIYFSQGNRTQKVNVAASASFNTPVLPPSFSNTLTVTPSDTGFNYIKLDDPGNKLYELVSVTRGDGQVIPLDNAWLTYVTLPVSRSPVYENKFHIVDRFATTGAATYNVVWKPVNIAVPKIDSIVGAPAQVVSTQVSNLRVYFNKRIDPSTFNYQDLGLTLQGGPNMINSSAVVTQLDTASFNIDLSAITTGNGLYTFTAQAADVKDVYGVSGLTGKQVSWSQFLDVPIVQEFQGIPAKRIASAYTTIDVLFNLPIDASTVTPARFSIYKSSVLQAGSLTTELISGDNKLFRLSGLQNILTEDGKYELRVDMPNIRSVNNIAGIEVQSITLTVDKTGPTLVNLGKSYTGGIDAQHVPFVNLEFNEGVVGLNTSAFSLTRNGNAVPLNIAQLLYVDSKHWSAGNFGTLTYPEGSYVFTVNLANVVDSVANTGAGTQQISWTVDRTALVSVTNVTISPDLGFSATDGITSGQTMNVGYNLSANASQVTISQIDLSGEVVLSNLTNVTAGNKSTLVTIVGGGQARIKVAATGANGAISTAEKVIYVDQLPLFAQWKFAPNQSLVTQVSAIPVAFSSKLLSATGLLNAIQLRRNGVLLPSTSLSVEVVNDTLYNINGIRNASTLPGTYDLVVNIQPFSKYSSGKTSTGTTSVSWTVQSANRAPVANAGTDITVTAPGLVTLNGSVSTDPDADAITYSWTASDGIVLSNASSATPSFSLAEANRDHTYSFLLVVSDGVLFSTDVVLVKFNTELSFTGLLSSYCSNVTQATLVGTPSGGIFSGMGVTGNKFDPAVAGAGTHTITYTKDGQSVSQTTIVSLAPNLGLDKTVTIICPDEKVNLIPLYVTTGLTVDWSATTPANTGAGTYELIVTNAAGCKDEATVVVKQYVATWVGTVSTDWNTAGNWDTGKVPDATTTVIIPAGTPTCTINTANGVAANVEIQTGARLKIATGFKLSIEASCAP